MGSSRRWRAAAIVVVSFAVLAHVASCGLELSGTAGSAGPGGGGNVAIDGAASFDGGSSSGDPLAPDAGDAGCAVSIVDGFTALDPATWVVAGSTTVAEAGVVELVAPDKAYTSGALWIRVAHPLDRFDVTFRARVAHSPAAGTPSDGFTVAWLHQADGGSEAPGVSTEDRSLGVPPGYDGFGVAFDTWQMQTGFVAVEASRGAPGYYAWEVSGTRPLVFALNEWHEVRVKFRDGAVEVTLDGASWSADAGSGKTFVGHLGFTAHSGFAGDGFYVASFDAKIDRACP